MPFYFRTYQSSDCTGSVTGAQDNNNYSNSACMSDKVTAAAPHLIFRGRRAQWPAPSLLLCRGRHRIRAKLVALDSSHVYPPPYTFTECFCIQANCYYLLPTGVCVQEFGESDHSFCALTGTQRPLYSLYFCAGQL